MQHIVFANTGVQLVCQPLASRLKLASDQLGWQRCVCLGPDGRLKPYHYLQWQVRNGEQLFFAIDTTCGDPELGFFCRADALAGDVLVSLSQVADAQQRPIANFPRVEIVIRPATAAGGDALPVQLVVDFGNSRTGALLIETSADHQTLPLMAPLELVNRFQLNVWDQEGQFQRRAGSRWFNSRTQWCQSPYLPPPRLEVKFFPPAEERHAGGFLERWRGGDRPPEAQFMPVTPRLFQDLSPARMGEEVDDISQAMQVEPEVRTGVSSPKRYLWAADGRWLAGGVWHMADPWQRTGTPSRSPVLQGPFFRFVGADDADELHLPDAAGEVISDEDSGRETPLQPRHPPRVLMVAAIYELLCQAAVYLNSVGYRRLLGDTLRPREIRALSLTFPSGMIPQERERFRLQAQKAVDIFSATLGRAQRIKPNVAVSIDEASAVHLTYIWSELQVLERNAKIWFSLMGKPRTGGTGASGVAELARVQRGGHAPATTQPAQGSGAAQLPLPEVRIGCIDIGGGTSDLMIARYTFTSGPVDTMEGEMLHRDGISLAGDQLAKRLIERIVVPHLADRIGFGREEVMRLFGQEVPSNHRFRAERIKWINRLFIPLVEAYLQAAGADDTQTTLTHTDPAYVAEDVIASLEQTIDQEFGAGQFNVRQELALRYDPQQFNQLVFEVFNELLLDYCGRLVKYDVDVVLLAGQPTKLKQIQDLVRQYLPLQAARVVPLHNHYAGNWYPYQDQSGRDPGVIVDPKSAVVVGAAVELLMSRGRLGNIQFSMKDLVDQDRGQDNEYYWGILTEGTCRIQDSRLLFHPPRSGEKAATIERQSFKVVAERLLIGRRLSSSEHAEATAVWALRVDPGDRDGKIDLVVTIERRRRVPGNAARPESLELVDVKGTIAGEPANMHEGPGQNVFFNWRTLAAENYFLDTGALDSIEM